MSDAQNEINNLKKMLIELSQRVEDAAIDSKVNAHTNIVNDENDSELSLSFSKLRKELEEANSKNRILTQEITSLKTEKENLEYENNKNIKKKDHYAKQMEQHEKNNRKLFELYSADKKELFNYRLLTEKLRQEIVSLENNIEKQEQRYDNLKNQLSYKLGSRIIGLKKSKDLLKLPKNLLDDYVSVKSKIDNSSTLSLITQTVPSASQPIYNNNREYTIFNKSATLPLKSKPNTIIFNQGFKGSLDLQLYGVKPSATVDIELTIRAHQSDAIFRIMPDLKHVHHLSANEAMTITITVNDDQAHQFMQVMSSNGTIEVVFRKKRGVPSFIHLLQIGHHNNIILDSDSLNNSNEVISNERIIPKPKKKSSLFREAIEIQKQQGFDIALLFLKKYTPEDQKSTINIFYANNELINETRWLSYINTYIKDHGMQPIELKENEKEKFYRIHSSTSYKVEDRTKISVIMPAYNAEKTIELSMKSILNQTWQNLELIVINDCSADRTSEIIKKIALTDSRVKFIDNPCNVGAYVSKNLGLKIATGDYITGHDADDWAYPQRLEQHMKLIRSEVTPPRASNTRMIRMEESGYLPLYPFGPFCHDGVMRVASITCMFEVNFLRNTLGGWDCSRFGADSEIISRCKMVIGDEFKNYKSLSMICLDEPTSLTNHPIHGVSKTSGISPTRKFYKEQWTEWHKTINKNDVYLEFPHLDRKFQVPEGTEIPKENILRAIKSIETNFNF
ncbi:glycosyltransferase [Psychrobacter sp. A3]|uniref:glycosyltransferase n=1 Tax=Psychrobacter sp. A3 TaxID=2992754 RepID=UPI00237B5318|nr:glycosyltransferase [Psychrobacter sp. A3]MDE0490144.1 glycosyltransferase [Psychrobacter sp. A3]